VSPERRERAGARFYCLWHPGGSRFDIAGLEDLALKIRVVGFKSRTCFVAAIASGKSGVVIYNCCTGIKLAGVRCVFCVDLIHHASDDTGCGYFG